MLLRDKAVLVTGASRGIDRAVALGCAREGAHVAMNYFGEPAGAGLLVDGGMFVNLQ